MCLAHECVSSADIVFEPTLSVFKGRLLQSLEALNIRKGSGANVFLIVRTHILLGVSGLYFACVLILQELNTFSGQIATVARLFCACVVFACMVFV